MREKNWFQSCSFHKISKALEHTGLCYHNTKLERHQQ